MTQFDPNYTSQFYDAYGARESARWDAGPRSKMQYAIFRHHLRQHVQAGDRVLDAGCGPGVYAKELLELGARVTCLDISNIQLESCREQAPGCESYELGSVTDLSRFADGSFDVSLAFGGVLSYCFEQTPQAMAELVRVTRPDGWVGVSLMNLFGSMHRFLPGVMALPVATNRDVVANGDLGRVSNDGHECHMFRVDEARQLLEVAGLQDVELHANGWLIHNDEIEIPNVDTDEWRFLFEAELEASRESPGAGTHIIAWGRVP